MAAATRGPGPGTHYWMLTFCLFLKVCEHTVLLGPNKASDTSTSMVHVINNLIESRFCDRPFVTGGMLYSEVSLLVSKRLTQARTTRSILRWCAHNDA